MGDQFRGPCQFTRNGACVWPDGEPEPFCAGCDHAAEHEEWLAELEGER